MGEKIILDLSREVCPFTLVLTRRHLKDLSPGQYLEIIISDPQALRNITLGIREEGGKIRKIDKLDRLTKILIEKGECENERGQDG